MIVNFNSNKFFSEMNNLVEYSIGFLDGVEKGKDKFLENFGQSVIQSLKDFIDSNARIEPKALHHIYEWYQVGSPDSRLFDITYSIKGGGLSFNSTFSQSSSLENGSNVPFYNKAEIMENGTPVTITPKQSGVLAFDIDGQQIFTKRPVIVNNPGGTQVQGAYEKVFKMFFDSYFSQSFLFSSGIQQYLSNPESYKSNIKAGARLGKTYGYRIGYDWIVKGGRIE